MGQLEDALVVGGVLAIPAGAAAASVLLGYRPFPFPAPLAAEVARAVVHYTVAPPPTPPKGEITRISPPDGEYIAPGSSFAVIIDFHNSTEVNTRMFYTRYIGKGVVSGTVYFDAISPSYSIAPCATRTMSSGTQIMPDEDLEVTIIVYS